MVPGSASPSGPAAADALRHGRSAADQDGFEIVDPVRFLDATRESGYQTFDAALAELVDNSMQAGASRIEITLPDPFDEPGEARVAVLDNGTGMSPTDLARALQFGGSNRFNDRNGLGRFGMGLPNSSLSHARRVDVYSWQASEQAWHTYLDLDEMLGNTRPVLPRPVPSKLPDAYWDIAQRTGTLVVWRKLDRVKHSTWRQLARRTEFRLGRKFRYFLWAGQTIIVNGLQVAAFDPLFLSADTRTGWLRAEPHGDPLEYEVRLDSPAARSACSTITVRFSELPVQRLAGLSNKEKRAYGIVNGAGVSIVRAGREIDYGWFLLDKRRENYDDWWRCEIQFGPELDEVFGVTHTKQGIRPSEDLKAMLSGELTAIARSLNRRVRTAHTEFAEEQGRQVATNAAARQDTLLRPVCRPPGCPLNAPVGQPAGSARQRYRVVVEELDEPRFYRAEFRDETVTLVLNRLHEFYVRFYEPLGGEDVARRAGVDLLLLALARTHQFGWTVGEAAVLDQFAINWSRVISVFFDAVGKERR